MAQDAVEPDIDPDLVPDIADVELPSHVPVRHRVHWRVLAVVAAGGALGALARFGIQALIPTPPGGFPWATFVINVTGCALIGALMVLVTDVLTARPLLRPFVGVGILGGYTTFSTYANEVRGLLKPGTLPIAFGYLAGTLVAALLAVLIGMAVTRAAIARTP